MRHSYYFSLLLNDGCLKIAAWCVLFGVSTLSARNAHAQPRAEANRPPTRLRFSKLTFNQDLNIFKWNYALNYQKELANRVQFEFAENFESTLQSITNHDLWKDNQDFRMTFKIPVSKTLSFNPEFQSYVLSDPLAGFDNDLQLYSGGGKLIFQPGPDIYFAPKVSSKWQTQVKQSDQGIAYGLETRIQNIDIQGYKNDFSFLGTQDYFPNRKNEDFKIQYRIERQFYEGTADTLILFLNRLRIDSFDSDAGGIFVRNLTQNNRGVENRLSYRLAPDVALFLRNSISSNTFEVNNLRDKEVDLRKDDKGFETNSNLSLSMQKPKWFGNVFWNFRSRERNDRRPKEKVVNPFLTRHPSLGFDTDQVNEALGLRGGLHLTRQDSLGVYASVSKFIYDTSDSTNPNSHDQLRWHFTFSHAHRFSPHLRLIWRANALLNHFVFVSSAFSSGNNWERIFQLTPEVYYQPSQNFYFRQIFTVRAKYQTYDFDDSETSNRNIVNRQFLLTNHSNFRLTRHTWLELSLNFELSEQGKLFYNQWRQRLALSWQNEEIQLFLKNHLGSGMVFSPGFAFFQQLRWDHIVNSDGTLSKRIKDKHTNVGPIFQLAFNPSPNLEFVVFGKTQFVISSQRKTDTINNIDVKLNWFF
ncbi:MAG: hypothetical protein ACE5HO_13145 [bacterium]